MALSKAPDLTQFSKLQGQLQSQLQNSPTAYTPNVKPSFSDLRTQIKLMDTQSKIDQAKNTALKADIYGTGEKATPNQKPGVFHRLLQGLGAPLYGVVGAVEAATGKGTKPGLANIWQNIKEQGTFGDLLRSWDVNKWAALPLGFALDLAFDPVNWLTMGTEALIPKLAKGLTSGGLEGLKEAVISGAATKATSALKFVPLLNKSTEGTGLYANLMNKGLTAETAFRKASSLPSIIEEAAAKSNQPTLLGKPFVKAWDYLKEKFPNAAGKLSYVKGLEKHFADTNVLDKQVAVGERNPLRNIISDLRTNAFQSNPDSAYSKLAKLNQADEFTNLNREGWNIGQNPPGKDLLLGKRAVDSAAELSDAAQTAHQIGEEATRQAMLNQNMTGINWYDSLRTKVNQLPGAKKVMNTYDFLVNGLFKWAKVPANPTAYVYATIGNGVMAKMMGVDITNPTYLEFLKAGGNIVRSKALPAEIASKIDEPVFQDFLRNHEHMAQDVGLTRGALDVATGKTLEQSLGKAGLDVGNINELAKMGKAAGITEAESQKLEKLRELTAQRFNPRATEFMGETFFRTEILQGQFGAKLTQWSKEGNAAQKKFAKLVNWTFEKYDSIDQTYKAGTTLYLSLNGVTASELQQIKNFIKLSPSDLKQEGNLFRILPVKAAEIAQTAFMNYKAMPAAAKLLRSMPVLGSPFASFAYAMASKTGSTLARNPALFNKINFLTQEIGRTQPVTPLEKEALAGPYYNYLNTMDRMKLPFFKAYPTYLNIANWLPYLSLNFFQPPERKYASAFGQNVGEWIDKLPFLKTPEGQLLFDYFIQPTILNEQNPTNMFGQPLYHESDTKLDKFGRIAQAITETFVPPLVPPGYRFRQLYHAAKGENVQGIQSSKSGWELFPKAAFSNLGAALSEIDLKNQAAALKKELKK